jgi:large subunit ribosomal protein L6
MSRIGKQPVPVPDGVQVNIDGSHVKVKGPKGELSWSFNPDLTVELEDEQVVVTRPTDQRHHRSLHGLTRALINNMVVGVSEGYQKVLEVVGTGYRAEMQGESLKLELGFSHSVEIEPPEGITFQVEERGKQIVVSGIDKQVIGQVAADIRKLRPPEPYKGKGIRYQGEYVRQKAGKAGKVGL